MLARTGDPDLAETITARVFLTVVRKFDQCKSSPAAWLWSIVRNELATHYRRRRDHAPLDPGIVDHTDGPTQRLAEQESQQRLHQALQQLNDQQHEVVYMKFFVGMTNTAIADALGLATSTVGVRIHRTLKRLRELMTQPAPEPTHARTAD